jgi:hypothetical protein
MRYVLTLLVAVGLSLTAIPATARPLHSHGETIAPPAPCARIVVTKHGDCTVRICVKRHHGHRHDRQVARHHKRHCLPPVGSRAR